MPDFEITFQNEPMAAYYDSEDDDFVPFVRVGSSVHVYLAPDELRKLADALDEWTKAQIAKAAGIVASDSEAFAWWAHKLCRAEDDHGTIDAKDTIAQAREMREQHGEDVAIDFLRNEHEWAVN